MVRAFAGDGGSGMLDVGRTNPGSVGCAQDPLRPLDLKPHEPQHQPHHDDRADGGSTPTATATLADWRPTDAVVVRGSRSQSLTDPPRVAIAASASTLSSQRDDLALRLHEPARLRRTASAELSSSLSLLQQELGYPRPRASSRSRAARRSRKSSGVVEEHEANESAATAVAVSSCGGSSASTTSSTSSSSTLATMADAAPCQPHVDQAKAVDDEVAGHGDDDDHVQDDEHEDDDEDEDDDDNFLDHRVATVTGFARDTDGVVYYEIVVESTAHGPLSAYKVRRRYSEFRELHRALARIMPTRPPSAATSSSSAAAAAGTRRFSLMGLDGGGGGVTSSGYHHRSKSMDVAESSVRSMHAQPIRTRKAEDTCPWWLPPLPDSGGLWSYFQSDSPRFLENRAKSFNAIVLAAQQHPKARASRLLNQFLGTPPDSCVSAYVSLNRFAAPTLRFSIEIQERKEKAMTISLRRRQLEPPSTMATTATKVATIAE